MKKTSIIREHMKMADVVHLDYKLLPIINRFGIQLGFGDLSIAAICSEKKINLAFFLEIINAYYDSNYFPKEKLQNYSVGLFVEYLNKTHEFYLNDKVPEIERMIDELVDNCVTGTQNLSLLRSFFNDYKTELTDHIKREEEKVYPYVLDLERAILNKTIPQELAQQIKEYSINDFAQEHDNVQEKLFDLKNIIIKYLPPPNNSNLCNSILSQLFELEKDLDEHSRLEDTILVPMVAGLENEFKLRIEKESIG
jgi:regulator of cell morphogenesis and NO signaling